MPIQGRYFTIRYIFFLLFIQVLDDKNVRRRFRASNYQSTTRVKPFICTMPMRLGMLCSLLVNCNYVHAMKQSSPPVKTLTFLFQNNILSFSDDGWNQIQFNLADFTRRAYGTNYVETLRVQIHANCRIRRVYFSDRLYSEDELPAEFKLYLPVSSYLIKILRWLSLTF